MKQRFTANQVLEIREQYARGIGLKRIAFGWTVNRKVIQDIVQGRTYKAVGGPLASSERICPTCRQVVGQRASNTSSEQQK